MSRPLPATAPGLHVQQLTLRGTVDARLGQRLMAALDAELALRGLHRVDIGRLQLDAPGLAAQGQVGLSQLAFQLAQRIEAASGQQGRQEQTP